ncbi:MAG: hypothetical protein JWO58_2241 [Chitinophagaceae bacterium]|nr:hypothetical protein [Chitinophagaceae bacterium]
MPKFLFCLSFILSLSYSGYAQRTKVSAEEKEAAQAEKKKHKDDDFLMTTFETNFSFSRDKSKTNPFSIKEIRNCTILCLKETLGSTYANSIYYDGTSTIDKFYAYNKKEKNDVVGIVTANQTYSSNGIFHDDTKLFSYSIAFANIGETESYMIEKKYTDPKYLTSVFFHDEYPITKRTISFNVPEWADVDFILKNTEKYALAKTITKDDKTKTTNYSFTINDLSADKSEKNQPSASAVLPHIIVIHKSYTKLDGTKENIFNDTKDLYKWYSSLTGLVENDKTVIKPVVEKVTAGKSTDIEKVKALFYWVQENIRYIAFEDGVAGYKPASCQEVYNNKYGDCKGMANLLKNMLVVAGYDARLTWVGTRHIPYNSHAIPALVVDNHMICTLTLNGKRYFLDPTETYIGIDDYAHRIQGREILIEDGDKFILDTIPSFNKEHNKIVIKQDLILESDMLKGKSHDMYYGEGKTNILRSYNSSQTDKRDEAIKHYLNNNDKNIVVSDITSSSMDDRSKPVDFQYAVSYKNQVVEDSDDKYISLDYDKEFKNFIFDTTRIKDYMLDYKYQINKQVRFKIPEGYSVKHVPQNLKKVTPDFSFNISFKEENGYVVYNKEITVDNSIIRKEDFKTWNQTIKELKKIYNDQVIITHKQ